MNPTEPDPSATPLATWTDNVRNDPSLQTFMAVTFAASTIVVMGVQCADYAGSIHSVIAAIATIAGWLMSMITVGALILLRSQLSARTWRSTLIAASAVVATFAALPALASNDGGWSAAMSAVIGCVYDILVLAVLATTLTWHDINQLPTGGERKDTAPASASGPPGPRYCDPPCGEPADQRADCGQSADPPA